MAIASQKHATNGSHGEGRQGPFEVLRCHWLQRCSSSVCHRRVMAKRPPSSSARVEFMGDQYQTRSLWRTPWGTPPDGAVACWDLAAPRTARVLRESEIISVRPSGTDREFLHIICENEHSGLTNDFSTARDFVLWPGFTKCEWACTSSLGREQPMMASVRIDLRRYFLMWLTARRKQLPIFELFHEEVYVLDLGLGCIMSVHAHKTTRVYDEGGQLLCRVPRIVHVALGGYVEVNFKSPVAALHSHDERVASFLRSLPAYKRICWTCRADLKIGTRHKCGACRVENYCSTRCQRLAWRQEAGKHICLTLRGVSPACRRVLNEHKRHAPSLRRYHMSVFAIWFNHAARRRHHQLLKSNS